MQFKISRVIYEVVSEQPRGMGSATEQLDLQDQTLTHAAFRADDRTQASINSTPFNPSLIVG